ncbi:MAG: hypothetical protein ACT4P9_10310 [Betaproteobacteria bacterium]
MRSALLLLLVAPVVLAQDQAIQRELIQRQQQSEQFNLQLRQSIEASKVPPSDTKRRVELESRQLGERQRLENVSERQLREVKPDAPQGIRPHERSNTSRELQNSNTPRSSSR